MKKKNWGVEWNIYKDRETGATVKQLTSYYGHHCHLYFTNPGWYDNGKKMLLHGNRDNTSNLFSVDLISGEITQLTDYPRGKKYLSFQNTYINPVRKEAYYWYQEKLTALDLETCTERVLYTVPAGFRPGNTSVTADGKYVVGACVTDLSDKIEMDLGNGYVGFDEFWEAHPRCFIFKAPIDGGETKKIHEEDCWIGHINASTSLPNILSFCHEGPWHKVDNRIWGLDVETGRAWKLRERKVENERVGHEYWYADGTRIGYHGEIPGTSTKFFGRMKYDGSDVHETSFPYYTGHIHSNDENFVVGDGFSHTRHVRIWRYNKANDSYEGPRAVCIHRSGMNSQILHVHPRFSDDGKQIVFSSDRTGYGSAYIVDVPDFDSLPKIED